MTAACIGTFVMAESGCWTISAPPPHGGSRRCSGSDIRECCWTTRHMLVKSGRFVTAGAALSHMDLALWLVRSISPQTRRAHREISHRRFAAVAVRVRAHGSFGPLRPSRSAVRAVGAGATHARVFIGRRGKGCGREQAHPRAAYAERAREVPLSYFQSLRVERAVHLLKTGNASVDDVAAQVGYSDGATLRTLLRRTLQLGVKEIRRA